MFDKYKDQAKEAVAALTDASQSMGKILWIAVASLALSAFACVIAVVAYSSKKTWEVATDGGN